MAHSSTHARPSRRRAVRAEAPRQGTVLVDPCRVCAKAPWGRPHRPPLPQVGGSGRVRLRCGVLLLSSSGSRRVRRRGHRVRYDERRERCPRHPAVPSSRHRMGHGPRRGHQRRRRQQEAQKGSKLRKDLCAPPLSARCLWWSGGAKGRKRHRGRSGREGRPEFRGNKSRAFSYSRPTSSNFERRVIVGASPAFSC